MTATEQTMADINWAKVLDADGHVHLPYDQVTPLSSLVFRRGPRICEDPRSDKAEKRRKGLGFEYAEHAHLGDFVSLELKDGSSVIAKDHPFTMRNGLKLTFGQINGLAADFYATKNPISDGGDLNGQTRNFQAAFDALDKNSVKMPAEATTILGMLQDEVDEINKAAAAGIDPSTVYAKLKDQSTAFFNATLGRLDPQLNYLQLSLINWDHSGADARTAYNAGHFQALGVAAMGDLERVYAMDAFACHYLEDSFSAGHIRTPRRVLHSGNDVTADKCAQYMHDEENAIGLTVANPAGETWRIYGDKRLLDQADDQNRARCLNAIQASVNEIFHAWAHKHAPQWPNYSAWEHAPVLPASQANDQKFAALFLPDGSRRNVIEHRCRDASTTYTKNWWFWSTAAACLNGGLWKYPITMNCPGVQLDNNGLVIGETTVTDPADY